MLERARAAGVSRMVAPAVDPENARQLPRHRRGQPDASGPWASILRCRYREKAMLVDELRDLARHPKVCAIGDRLLDYFHAPPEGWTVETWRASGPVLDQ